MAEVESTVKIGINLGAPFVRRGVDKPVADRQPRIVDQDIEAAEVLRQRDWIMFLTAERSEISA